MCKKAGKLELGFDSSIEAVKSGKATLLIIAEDISPKTLKEINFHINKFCGENSEEIKILDIKMKREDFAEYFKKNIAVMAVCDEGFKNAISKINSSENKIL
jgi:ribosomal protein L7Ae-like RNA K-turn-binding protein